VIRKKRKKAFASPRPRRISGHGIPPRARSARRHSNWRMSVGMLRPTCQYSRLRLANNLRTQEARHCTQVDT
jgi:hypothetical protein